MALFLLFFAREGHNVPLRDEPQHCRRRGNRQPYPGHSRMSSPDGRRDVKRGHHHRTSQSSRADWRPPPPPSVVCHYFEGAWVPTLRLLDEEACFESPAALSRKRKMIRELEGNIVVRTLVAVALSLRLPLARMAFSATAKCQTSSLSLDREIVASFCTCTSTSTWTASNSATAQVYKFYCTGPHGACVFPPRAPTAEKANERRQTGNR